MEKYHIRVSNESKGPYSIDEIITMGLTPNDYVWKKGMDNWLQAKDIPELENIFQNIPPPIPQSPIPESPKTLNIKNETLNLKNNLLPKLYSENSILLAGFLCSPLAGCYLIGQNFKSLGDSTKQRSSILIGVSVTILICWIGFLLDNKVPNTAFIGVNIGVMWGILNYYGVTEMLKSHKEHGGEFFSNWRAVGVGLLVLLGFFVLAFLVIMILFAMGIIKE